MLWALQTCGGTARCCDRVEGIAWAADANAVTTPAASRTGRALIGRGEAELCTKGTSSAWDWRGRALDAIGAKLTQNGLRRAQGAVGASGLRANASKRTESSQCR